MVCNGLYWWCNRIISSEEIRSERECPSQTPLIPTPFLPSHNLTRTPLDPSPFFPVTFPWCWVMVTSHSLRFKMKLQNWRQLEWGQLHFFSLRTAHQSCLHFEKCISQILQDTVICICLLYLGTVEAGGRRKWILWKPFFSTTKAFLIRRNPGNKFYYNCMEVMSFINIKFNRLS